MWSLSVPSHGYDKCPWVFGLLFFQSLQNFLLLDWKKLKISIHSSKSILAWVIVSWNRDQVDLISKSLGAFCGLWMSEVILSPLISGSYRQSLPLESRSFAVGIYELPLALQVLIQFYDLHLLFITPTAQVLTFLFGYVMGMACSQRWLVTIWLSFPFPTSLWSMGGLVLELHTLLGSSHSSRQNLQATLCWWLSVASFFCSSKGQVLMSEFLC